MEEVKGYQPHRTEHLHIQRIEIDDRVERLQWPTLSLYITGQRQPSYERGKLLVLTPGRADRSPHLRNPALKFAGRDPELSGGTFEQVALLHRRDG